MNTNNRSVILEIKDKMQDIQLWEATLCTCVLRLEQLLRIFRALQTSCVLHISMNARCCMNQLLSKKKMIRITSFRRRSLREANLKGDSAFLP